MARARPSRNGHDRLEEAMATLIQNQAASVGRMAEGDRERADLERRHLQYQRESAERFARIEQQTAEIIRIVTEHNRAIDRLTEAIRDRIGFKG